jgi:type II secretory ATPase GspE/PulE/Tfp pilus assembly ATPase PilB-like protein
MHEDAILKVLEGKTTLEEVRRILGEVTEKAQ